MERRQGQPKVRKIKRTLTSLRAASCSGIYIQNL